MEIKSISSCIQSCIQLIAFLVSILLTSGLRAGGDDPRSIERAWEQQAHRPWEYTAAFAYQRDAEHKFNLRLFSRNGAHLAVAL
jgi:hypothetical protein